VRGKRNKASITLLAALLATALLLTACKSNVAPRPPSVTANPAYTASIAEASPTAAPQPSALEKPVTPPPLNPLVTPSLTVPASSGVPVSIPAAYQSLYTELDSELAAFERTLAQNSNHIPSKTIFAVEEAFANGNVGEGLLTAKVMENNRLLLDRLQSMGVKGVVLGIKFPLLKPDFPRSSEYLQFFKQIMVECRQRNMKVLVECGAIFSGTPYSPVVVDWSKYTAASFLQGLQDQLVLIAKEIKPNYLTLANEPTTEEALSKFSLTPAVWSNFIASTLKSINRSGGLLVGAGTGTWENPAYINTVIHMPGLDYVDLHIYPLNTDGAWLERALQWAAAAHAAGKQVTISEAWLYKASSSELGSGGLGNAEKMMNRDFYSFWSPLDARFVKDIMELSAAGQIDFASFFWMRNFFAYLDYETTSKDLSTGNLNRLINQAAMSNIQQGTTSPLGKYFQQALVGR
jgi:hypothetical protein